MFTHALRTFILAAAVVALAGMAVALPSNASLKADIPFAFTVGEKSLPAGTYIVERYVGASVYVIRDANLAAVATVHINALQKNGGAKATELVFNKYGEKYFLAEFWAAGAVNGAAIVKSSHERELASTPRETHTVLAAIVR